MKIIKNKRTNKIYLTIIIILVLIIVGSVISIINLNADLNYMGVKYINQENINNNLNNKIDNLNSKLIITENSFYDLNNLSLDYAAQCEADIQHLKDVGHECIDLNLELINEYSNCLGKLDEQEPKDMSDLYIKLE